MTQHGRRLWESGDIATGEVKTEDLAGYAVTDPKIGTGEVKTRALFKDQGEGLVTDAGTEFAHDLGATPVIFEFHPTTDGVMGYVQESARSQTSVTLKGNVSGVYVKWTVQA